jgi:amidase
MRFEEYRSYDAVALAGLVANGDVTAGELLEVAIARADAVDPKINAIVHKQYERARATVDRSPRDRQKDHADLERAPGRRPGTVVLPDD